MKSFTQLLPLLASLTVASPVDLSKSGLHKLFVRQDVQTAINASLPNVTIFATGGTIASQGSTNTQTTGYSIGLGVQQLVDAVPELLNISNIAGYQVSNVDSGSVNETISLKLAQMINEELAKPEIAGVVITHGTDTLEETAFFLESTVNSTKPVICVGAMRPATALSADGPLNLYQAVVLAGSPAGRDRGTMIVLNDRIGSAFYTTKNNANTLDTFSSTEAGQLGVFVNQVPYFFYAASEPVGRVVFDVSNVTDLAQVPILYAHQDMDTALFNASVASGAQGIVYAGVGAGGMSRKANLAAEELYNATHIPIVASHRSADGLVPPAGEGDFIISSGFYNPQKSRILLQLGLTLGWSNEEIAAAFAKTSAGAPAPSSRVYTENVPQTSISRAAFTHAASLLAPSILSHSMRVYLYAKALAEHSASVYATEAVKRDLLFTACLFHDIGTTDKYDGAQRFEIEGGDAAVGFLAQFDVGEVEKHDVWTAIACHTSPQIAERIGELSRLVRLAVITDFGRKSAVWDDLVSLREGLESEFGRAGIEKVLGDVVVEQAKRRPEKAPMVSWPGVMYRAHVAEPEWSGVNKMF
ncbi:Asparaginase/glutaminase [Boeremia exigua]|uniref:Asparaginase/glutaminase n=1 Tax=Boeremia exigua TaxID=749465 RepID=UPI001E8EDE78|nr:Asparaginase/glutaminase [Boeremia exigua]KAH6614237.1 Asparaginase/glutaminase [Boeremia exigua]